MTAELNLLKVFSIRSNLDLYLRLVNPKILSVQSITILKDYQDYFKSNPGIEEINFSHFKEYFFIVKHPNMEEKQQNDYKEILNRIYKIEIQGYSCTQIITSFQQQEFYSELHNDLDKNIDIKSVLKKCESFKDNVDRLIGLETQDQDMDLEQALTYIDRSNGLKWRLNCLNEHFRGGLIKGDCVLLSGYVDSGKTGFCCSEISNMAQQLTGDEYIAWLNTEGNWEQIIPRIYCATLGCTFQDLINHKEKAIGSYIKKMNGDKNRIRVFNFQLKSTKDVEDLIMKRPPSLIVFDQLDHIQGFSKLDSDSVEKYGHLYQWARTIATHHCPVIIVSQMNRNGNDNPYPPMTELSGSGEKKQAAATAMIMLGSVQGNDTERFLSTPKNKIGGGKGFRQAVKFDPLRSRFSD